MKRLVLFLSLFVAYAFATSKLNAEDLEVKVLKTSFGYKTPIEFLAQPQIILEVKNQGSENETNVKAELYLGKNKLLETSPIEISANASQEIKIENQEINLEGVELGKTIEFTIKLSSASETSSKKGASISTIATAEEFVFDNLSDSDIANQKFILGDVLLTYFTLGHMFNVTTTDTLTAIEIGLYDVTSASGDYEILLDVIEMDESLQHQKRRVYTQPHTRPAKGGLVRFSFPAILLTPGNYIIGISSADNNPMIVADEDKSKFSYNYDKVEDTLGVFSSNGAVIVRAIFGNNAKIYNKDVEVLQIKNPYANAAFSENEPIVALIRNNTANDLDEFRVTCTVNGETQRQPISLAAFETATIEFDADMSEPGKYTITVETHLEGDEVEENNSKTVELECTIPNPYIMDFEFCEDWSSKNFIPAWTTVDEDNLQVGSALGFEFPNIDRKKAWIVFNPNAMESKPNGFDAHGGTKYAMAQYCVGGLNADWLISPKLAIHQATEAVSPHLKFYYRTMYGDVDPVGEAFKVLISETDSELSSFKVVLEEDTARGKEWKQVIVPLYQYQNKEIYVAIKCVSNDARNFMIDDIEIVPGEEGDANEALEKLSSVSLYPNPARENIVIRSSFADIDKVEIINYSGTQVYRSKNGINSRDYRLNISKFAAGMYIAKVYTKNGSETIKFIVK